MPSDRGALQRVDKRTIVQKQICVYPTGFKLELSARFVDPYLCLCQLDSESAEHPPADLESLESQDQDQSLAKN